MMLEHAFRCPLTRGIHARPASYLQSVARVFASSIAIRNMRNGRVANAHSVFSLVGADMQEGDDLRLSVSGPDQDEAIVALRRHIEDKLPFCDDPTETVTARPREVALPYSLKAANPTYLRGTSVVAGAAQAVLHVVRGSRLPDSLDVAADTNPLVEKARVDQARRRLAESIEDRMRAQSDDVAGQILYVHRCMLADEEFVQTIADAILVRRCSAARAILEARDRFTRVFADCENVAINERALDVDDLCAQLLREIYGPSILPCEPIRLAGPSIVAADSLTPSVFLSLDKSRLKGLVLGVAGATSHTVILARTRGIPSLVSMDLAQIESHAGRHVVLDGTLGLLVVEPNARVREYYRLEQIKHQLRQERFCALQHMQAKTRDGVPLEIAANITCVEDARVAFDTGADGVGLFRTEMLYMDRRTVPDANEQAAIYAQVLRIANGRPVIFRTLDVGGDKPISCVPPSPRCDGPGGDRGIQFYVNHEALFRTQLRALLHASAAGPARIMIPMVTSLEEVRWIKSIFDQVKSELAADGIDHDASVGLGAMIETPAAARVMDRLCEELDFFSIGTNDLTQSHLDIDRTRVSDLAVGCHPSLLRLFARIVAQARQGGKWIGVCGELAADGIMLPFWLGLGVNEISVTPMAVARLKTQVGAIDAKQARQLVPGLCESTDSEHVMNRLLTFRRAQGGFPLLDPELILTGVEADSKEQAIKILVDRLCIVGRTDDPVALENALWQRESTYSTGLGHGFAVPHCDNEALLADTISVMKFTRPIEWNSVDDEPISVLIFLGRRGGDSVTHLQVFATLSRCLMREDFRQTLLQEDVPDRVADFLGNHLKEGIRT